MNHGDFVLSCPNVLGMSMPLTVPSFLPADIASSASTILEYHHRSSDIASHDNLNKISFFSV